MMRLTQGTFSYLPDLTDEEIAAQVSYAIRNGWAVSVEHCARPHPREVYWEMWGAPMFDLSDPAPALEEINACRRAHPDHYIRVGAYDASYGRQSTVLQFLVNRPANEPGFDLEREEGPGRAQRYRIRHRATA